MNALIFGNQRDFSPSFTGFLSLSLILGFLLRKPNKRGVRIEPRKSFHASAGCNKQSLCDIPKSVNSFEREEREERKYLPLNLTGMRQKNTFLCSQIHHFPQLSLCAFVNRHFSPNQTSFSSKSEKEGPLFGTNDNTQESVMSEVSQATQHLKSFIDILLAALTSRVTNPRTVATRSGVR